MSSKKWTVDPTRDQGFFDGSADPNPGGILGLGWHIIFRDGRTHEGSRQKPPHPGNTNNVAEYRALIELLRDYAAQGGSGPLIVRGDSQLVLNQVIGTWRVSAPGLSDLWRDATGLVKQLGSAGVAIEWAHIPRGRNLHADQLASGRAPIDPKGCTRALEDIPHVSPRLARAIAAARDKGNMTFKDAAKLRVGGRDSASDLSFDALAERAGPACVAVVMKQFPEANQSKARESALRWCLRGLTAELACYKVGVDLRVAANHRE